MWLDENIKKHMKIYMFVQNQVKWYHKKNKLVEHQEMSCRVL
jgi:hypothetical protein